MLAALVALSAHGAVVDRIAAIVDDEVIAISEVYDIGSDYIDQRCPRAEERCVRGMELEVLDVLIKRQLMRAELVRLDMRVTGEELDQAIDRYARASGYEDRLALRRALEEQGTRWDTFRDEMREQIRTQRFQQRILLPRVSITDDEVKDLYQRTSRQSKVEEVLLDAIGIAIPADADEALVAEMTSQTHTLVDTLNAGGVSWEEAVEKYDGANLANIVGGQRYRRGTLSAAVDRVAFEGTLGQVQAPVRIGDVLFVIVPRERAMADAGVAAFEDVEDKLKDQVFQEKVLEAEEEWYQLARRQSAVQVLLESE